MVFRARKKNQNQSIQDCIVNERAEIRAYTRIQIEIKVKYNKPDIFLLDKIKKEIIIIEVGITPFENFDDFQSYKKLEHGLIANYCGSLDKYKIRIIPYLMTWDGVVTKFHKRYRTELDLDNRIQEYVQFRVLKMTLEIFTVEGGTKLCW